MKTIDITFKNLSDFRNRIAHLWQKQKDDEVYNLIFLTKDAEEEFEKLCKAFAEGQ